MLYLLGVWPVIAASPSAFQYISPLPGSTFVSRETNIIIRPGDPIDRNSISDGDIQVMGETSGRHAGDLILSDDTQTLVFAPTSGFTDGEKVTVTLAGGIRFLNKVPVPGIRFSFTITTTPREVQARRVSTIDPGVDAGQFLTWQPQLGSFLDSLPQDFPPISVSVSDNPFPGYIFLSNIAFDPTVTTTPYLMVLDNGAHPVFYRRLGGFALDTKVQPNGLITYYDTSVNCFVEADTSFDDSVLFRCGNGYVTDAHELRVLQNGHALLLGQDYETVRMDTIVPGGHPRALVIGAVIQELDRAGNVVFQWRSWDHYNITDATHEDLTDTVIDYVHANALEADNDGNILLSSRHMDEITKIDRQTGDIIWRLGGKHNEFTFVGDTIGFSHQHAIRRLSNGDITLFDNGNFHNPPFSRAVEYRLDEVNRTATLIWQYRNHPDIYSVAMGYVQRLDSNNTLIGWGGTSPAVTEVRADGSKALEIGLPPGVYSYRAFLFPSVGNARLVPAAYNVQQNYPNPFNPTTSIKYSLPQDSYVALDVYNVLGQRITQLVNEQQRTGQHEVTFNGSNLGSGVYFYRLATTGFTSVKKMLLLK